MSIFRFSNWLVLSLSVACTEVKSSAVTTQGMYVDYEVVTEGEGTGSDVNTTLRVGGLTSTTFVDLDGGDQLTVSVGDENEVLNQQTFGVIHSYQSTFVADTEGSEFVLSLDRVDMDGAPATSAIIPAAFTIATPQLDESFSRSGDGDIVVTWDAQSDDLMKIVVEGGCFVSYLATGQQDSGSHLIPLSYFQENEYDATSTCDATVTVDRQRIGSVDPGFGGGLALGVQRRSISIRIEP